VATALWPVLGVPFRAAGALLFVLLAADALSLWRRDLPSVERALPATMALGERYDVTLRVSSPRNERVQVFDRPPGRGEAEGLPGQLRLGRGRALALTYRFRPLARGELAFGAPSLGLTGPLGRVEREVPVGAPAVTRVYPNFRRVSSFVAPGEQSLYRGMHATRQRGQGMEFHQMREYREGDALRQVDWKSVARRQQLISREYRSEQNQNVVFLVDGGRRMRAHDGTFSLLDQALDALLLLSYVALRQGDSVGVLACGRDTRWLAPVRGASGLTRVLDTVYDLESSPESSDLEQALALLAARQRRRALLVLLTNLGDDDVEGLRTMLASLRAKHLVLVASLRDPAFAKPLAAPPRSDADALSALSALAYLDARNGARERLNAAGIATLESEPNALPGVLIERYLMIKRAGNL